MKKLFSLFCLIFLLAANACAQKEAFTISDLYKIKYTGSPVISHSGDKICFIVTKYDLQEGTIFNELFIMNNDGSDIQSVAKKDSSKSYPFWSSDGNRIYYVSDSQIHCYNLKEADIEKITSIPSGVVNPILSPNGNLIAFTTNIFPECGTDSNCNKKLIESSKNGPLQAYLADSLLFRHWTEYEGERETHIFIYNLKTKIYTDAAHTELASNMYRLGGRTKYNFSPDSKELCYIANPDSFRAASINSDLYIVSVNGGGSKNIININDAWDGYPVYSPDGKFIAFKMTKQPGHESDRYRIAIYDRASKKINILTEDFDNTVQGFKWSPDSKFIYFTAAFEGYTPLYKLDIESKKISEITGRKSVSGFDLFENKILYRSSKVGKPREIYEIDLDDKSGKQLTFFNKELMQNVDIRPAEEIWVEGAGRIKVQVFIIKPHNFDPRKKYPLILNVHGGPQGQWRNSFRGDWQIYPGSGYIVAFANPHGSTGRGQAYTNEISGDWGGMVFEDLMKVTDWLEKLPYVDTSRIGSMGWSFGGYMMNWFQAKTDRFKCLASMMGVYDLESMWGATEELWFVNWDLEGQPWNSDDYQEFSPSNYVKNFSTPTLIITGQKDFRVPYTQSIQYFTTLQALGIDSRLIIFKNDGHHPDYVKSMPLYYNAHLEWFHKYLGGAAAPYDSHDMVKNIVFDNDISLLKE